MKYLMIFAIGPVQDFIATARRSRDLWYGSWMLSELSKAAAKAILKMSPSGELIFPSPSKKTDLNLGSKFTAPNKIVAVVSGGPNDAAVAIHSAIKTRMGKLWGDAKKNTGGEYYDEIARKQIDDLVEFYWVSVPYDDSDEKNYARAREKTEAILAARKVTRDFIQPTWSSNSPKSSLDGARESVIPKSEYSERGDSKDTIRTKTEDLYKNYHARRGEQLSGVDLLKRLGSPANSPKFKSTSDMAAIPFIQWLNDKDPGKGDRLIKKIRAEIRKYLTPEEVKKLEDGEGLVFESRYADSFPLQELSDKQKRDFAAQLEKYAGKKKPNPYYALLAADGDFMGRVIDAHKKKGEHKEISKSLADFAVEALKIVEGNQGVPIYSGGDDVLAYLPLNTALKCAQELEAAFETIVGKHSAEKIKPTLSIGIVIVHHLEPLSDALELVRKAEQDAKSVDGKNGLAVILSKRSGTDRAIVDKFETLHERLMRLMELFSAKAISGGAAYELQELHRILSKTNIPAAGVSGEAIRIIGRKRESGGERPIDPKVREKFEKWIKGKKGNQEEGESNPVALDELVREMIIAKELAGKEEE